MAKKKRKPTPPAIGKNEQRILDSLKAKAREAMAKGQFRAHDEIMRRHDKLKRHYVNSAAWKRGERW